MQGISPVGPIDRLHTEEAQAHLNCKPQVTAWQMPSDILMKIKAPETAAGSCFCTFGATALT